MEQEIWKTIPGFENYQASNLGHIRRVYQGASSVFGQAPTCYGEPLEPTLRLKDKYLVISLRATDGKKYQKGVHQFVLLTFVGPPPEGMQTLHADGVRANCALLNLSYGTALANAADRTRHGRTGIGEKNGNVKLTDTQVLAIRKMKEETNCTYASIGLQFNITPNMVGMICKRMFRTNI